MAILLILLHCPWMAAACSAVLCRCHAAIVKAPHIFNSAFCSKLISCGNSCGIAGMMERWKQTLCLDLPCSCQNEHMRKYSSSQPQFVLHHCFKPAWNKFCNSMSNKVTSQAASRHFEAQGDYHVTTGINPGSTTNGWSMLVNGCNPSTAM